MRNKIPTFFTFPINFLIYLNDFSTHSRDTNSTPALSLVSSRHARLVEKCGSMSPVRGSLVNGNNCNHEKSFSRRDASKHTESMRRAFSGRTTCYPFSGFEQITLRPCRREDNIHALRAPAKEIH